MLGDLDVGTELFGEALREVLGHVAGPVGDHQRLLAEVSLGVERGGRLGLVVAAAAGSQHHPGSQRGSHPAHRLRAGDFLVSDLSTEFPDCAVLNDMALLTPNG